MVSAAEEFKKNSDLKETDLKSLKEWISKQPYLPQNIPDETLIVIMHSCYYRPELSKQTVDHYFTLRTHLPEFFIDRDLERDDLQHVYETVNVMHLEGRTKEGYQVVLGGLRRTEPHLYEFADSFKMLFMLGDALLQTEGTVPGVVIVTDFAGMKFGHLAKLTLSTMKKVLTYVQEGSPVRLKGFHFINVVPFIDKVIALMKPFMKKELLDLLMLHSEGSETIYDFVPKLIFPTEYGGSAGTIDQHRERSHQLMKQFKQWYKDDELMRIDESRRPGKAKSASELFGVDGSFRKLAID